MGCRVSLGDICTVSGGKRLPKGTSLTQEKNRHPYIRVRDLSGNKLLELDANFEFVDDATQAEIAKYTVSTGDLVLSIVGTIGLLGKVGTTLDGANLTENCVKLSRFNNVDSDYLYYFLRSNFGQDEIAKRTVGAVQPKLPIKNIRAIEVTLPSLECQQKIATILSTIDKKLTLNARLNGYLEELLLTQFAALVPNENWSEGRADSYYEIGIGKTPPRKEPEWFSDVKADNHVWLSIKDMGEEGAYSLDSSEYLTDAAVKAKNVRMVPVGSVLLSFKLTVGRVKIAGCNMTTNEAIACFASDDKRKLAYAYPYLRSFDYGKLGSTSSIATAVNSKTVKAMPFAMPGDSELDAFYASTKPIYEQLLAGAKESRSLAQLRDALLPKLMSGEIDVSKVDLTQLNSHLA